MRRGPVHDLAAAERAGLAGLLDTLTPGQWVSPGTPRRC